MLPLSRQILSFNGRELTNQVKLNAAGVRNDDLLLVALAPEGCVLSSQILIFKNSNSVRVIFVLESRSKFHHPFASFCFFLQNVISSAAVRPSPAAAPLAAPAAAGAGPAGGMGMGMGGMGSAAPARINPETLFHDPAAFRQLVISDPVLMDQISQVWEIMHESLTKTYCLSSFCSR